MATKSKKENKAQKNDTCLRLSWRQVFGVMVALGSIVAFIKIPVDLNEAIEYYNSFNFFRNESQNTLSNFHPLFAPATNDSLIRLIILPLHPDEECRLQETDYDRNIRERFNNLKQDGFEILVIYDSTQKCLTDEEACMYGKKNNADAVLYGQYDEQCRDFSKRVKFKFAIVDPHMGLTTFWETQYEKVGHVEELAIGQHEEMVEGLLKVMIAQKYLKAKNHEKALSMINQVIDVDSHSFTLFIKTACLLHLERPREIIDLKSQILNNIPIMGYLPIGDSYILIGDSVKAFECYNIAIDSLPDSLKCLGYYKRAILNYASGNFYRTIQDCNITIKTEEVTEFNKDIFYYRMLAYYKLEQYPYCLKDLNLLLQYDPDNCRYLADRMTCYLFLGNNFEARIDYDNALKHKCIDVLVMQDYFDKVAIKIVQ